MHAVLDNASMCCEINMVAGYGSRICTPAQLTTPMLEAMLSSLPSLLQDSSFFGDTIRKQLTVPLVDYILKDLMSEGETAAAMDIVTRAIQLYPAEEPSLFKKAFLAAWHLAITTGQDAKLEQLQYLQPTDAASLAHAARVKMDRASITRSSSCASRNVEAAGDAPKRPWHTYKLCSHEPDTEGHRKWVCRPQPC